MMSEKEQSVDLSTFINFLAKYYKTLGLYFIIGGTIAFVLTLFVPKQYVSYAVVFPPSSTSFENSVEFPNFGYDIEAERLIQVLQSRELRDSVIRRFDLLRYFEIDKKNPMWLDQLVKRYYKNIYFERTPSMAVLITAQTKDPELSANIVNFIVQSVDGLREKIYKINVISAYENAKTDYERQKSLVDSVVAVLGEKLNRNQMSTLWMLSSDAHVTLDLNKVSSSGNSTEQAKLGAELIELKGMYEVLKEYRLRYVKVKKTYDNPIPKIYVINYAEPNYKKASPSGLTNSLVGAFLLLFVALVVLLLKQTYASK